MLNKLLMFLFIFSLSCKEKSSRVIVEIPIEQQIDSIEKSNEETKELNNDSIIDLLRNKYPTYSISINNDFVTLTDTAHNKILENKTHYLLKQYDSIIIKKKLNTELDIVTIDTIEVLKKHPIYNHIFKDSLFYLKSKTFTTNKLKCQWEYGVNYTNSINENSSKILVDLKSQKLINVTSKEVILNLDLNKFYFIYSPIDITILSNNNFKNTSVGDFVTYTAPYGYGESRGDINQDGFFDYTFMTEHAAAGTNIAQTTYLFNNKNKKFEYSDLFSGYNIEYDKEKNRISSFAKNGYGNYYYSYYNLKQNKIGLDFIEKVHHYIDTIYYKKLVKEKIVEEKKIVLGENENFRIYLERN